MNTWLTTEPPKDAQFLADVGLPYAVVAAWNNVERQYVFPDFQMSLYNGKWNDAYFCNDYISTIKKWMPLPEIDNEMEQ